MVIIDEETPMRFAEVSKADRYRLAVQHKKDVQHNDIFVDIDRLSLERMTILLQMP